MDESDQEIRDSAAREWIAKYDKLFDANSPDDWLPQVPVDQVLLDWLMCSSHLYFSPDGAPETPSAAELGDWRTATLKLACPVAVALEALGVDSAPVDLVHILLRHPDKFAGPTRYEWLQAALAVRRACARIDASRNSMLAAPDPAQTVPPPDDRQQFVTLLQAAAWVQKSKQALKKLKAKMPPPTIHGGAGKADQWAWREIRPWLQKQFDRRLPECLPSLHSP